MGRGLKNEEGVESKKMDNLKKIPNEHAIKEHIRVFLLGLDCKKKCIVRSRRKCMSIFGAFSYSAK